MPKSKRARAEKPWSTMDLFDLRRAIEQAETIELTASVLGRTVNEVLRKAEELNLIQRHDH
jgi:hypothetical protein